MSKFKFIDLFAGIGGFHLAMESLGGECVFASEIDPFARKTYEANFKKKSPDLFLNNMFNDDIRKVDPYDLPDFDILCAGFPCQPFSQAGQKRGFHDNNNSERGNLFFNIAEILEVKKPIVFFLENVRGIISHDNGNTFKVIRNILERELGYSFHYKVVQALDYGLPQLRPRTFMIGFRDEEILSNFSFPPKIPLKFKMSDVWGGECSREIGFTLRVGGRGSGIDDRRNWDAYLVDGKVKKLMPEQAKKMQGFPEDFVFPVPDTQAMKQLGNSVAVDAIRECARAIIAHLETLSKGEESMQNTKNKGEWTELYSFLKLIHDKKLMLADKNLNINNDIEHFCVTKVSTLNIEETCYLDENDVVRVYNETTGVEKKVQVSEFLDSSVLKNLIGQISSGNATFSISEFDAIQNNLGISIIKGGNSKQKSDIVLGIQNSALVKNNEGFGIKSYVGSKPSLLNASGNTNFVFNVFDLDIKYLHEINNINTKTKLKDRLNRIYELGGSLDFDRVEKETMSYNLSLVDSCMPQLLAKMLLEFYKNRTSIISKNLENTFNTGNTFNTDLHSLQVKVKRLLLSALLGFFAGQKWNGKYIANGIIVVKEDGEQVGFHIVDRDSLEDYLFENIRFDTPSTDRHRFGSLISENNGKLYFKLNLQLRF